MITHNQNILIHLIQALWRGAVVRHRVRRLLCFSYIAPKLQAIVRGFLFRHINPLGRYFAREFRKFVTTMRRDAAIEHRLYEILPLRMNEIEQQVRNNKATNARIYANFEDLRRRQDDLSENPEAHYARIERRIALMARREERKRTQRQLQSNPRLRQARILSPPISPVRTPSSSALMESHPSPDRSMVCGVAYNASAEAGALARAQRTADKVEAQVSMLQYQLSFLRNKFANDNRRVQAEVEALVSSAQQGFAQRQLRHVMRVSELRRVYNHQKEFSRSMGVESAEDEEYAGNGRGSSIANDADVMFASTKTDFNMQPQHTLPQDLTWSSNMIAGVSPKGFTM